MPTCESDAYHKASKRRLDACAQTLLVFRGAGRLSNWSFEEGAWGFVGGSAESAVTSSPQ